MRPTITTTIGRFKVEHYEYATPRDMHVVRDFQTKNPTEEVKANEMLLEKMIVSIDGSKDNVLDKVLDGFNMDEYIELQEKIVATIDTKKKSKPAPLTTATNE